MRVALATDAWAPQINGVVRSLTETAAALGPLGHSVEFITPEGLPSWPLPTYPDIRLAIGAGAAVAERLDRLAPDALHIATEGPIGHAARRWAMAGACPSPPAITPAIPNMCGPARPSGGVDLCLAAPLPRAGLAHPGADRDHAARARLLGLPEPVGLVARRRFTAVPAAGP